MKTQTTITTAVILCCLTLFALLPHWQTEPVGAAAPPTTTVCGPVTAYAPATAVNSGLLTIGGVNFNLAPGSALTGVSVGVNVCATFCFNAAGQIASVEGGVTANTGGLTRFCGIVTEFTPYVSIKVGAALLRIAPGVWLEGQTIVAPGVDVCLTAKFNDAGQLTSGSSVAESPGPLQVRVPALVYGTLFGRYGNEDKEDIFRLPSPFVLNVAAPVPAGVSVTPVGGYFATPYTGFDSKGIFAFTSSTPNSVARAVSCADSLWDLFVQIETKGATDGDMITLSLQNPDGTGSIVLAMFTVQNGGLLLIQRASDVELQVLWQGSKNVGNLIPLTARDGALRSPTLVLIFSMNSPRLDKCLQYVAEIKRAGGQGMTSILHGAVVVKRVELISDRDGSQGPSLNYGDLGWFPTGLPCAMVCNVCQPPVQPQLGSLSGYVYCDKNNDGVRQSDELGLAGVTVTLTGTDANGAVNRTATTDANGFYIFNDLKSGDYKLTETQPPGVTDGKDTVGTLGGTTTDDMFAGVWLPPQGIGSNYNFGEICAGPTPTPTPAKCDTICWRSTQYLLNNSRYWPGGTVLAAGYNANNPISIQSNLATLRVILQGGPSAIQRLNREFVTAQISLNLAGGGGSPVVFNTFWSPLRCSQVSFSPLTLSNGVTFTPDSLLDTLMNQTVQAIRDNRQGDFDELTTLWSLLNGKCGY